MRNKKIKKLIGKTPKIDAYTDGKPTFKRRGQSGVYLIYAPDGVLKYVGMSASDIYKACYRHFQEWTDRKIQRFTYPRDYKVRFIFLPPYDAKVLEKILIKRSEDIDGKNKYEGYFNSEKRKQKFINVTAKVKEIKTLSPEEIDLPF